MRLQLLWWWLLLLWQCFGVTRQAYYTLHTTQLNSTHTDKTVDTRIHLPACPGLGPTDVHVNSDGSFQSGPAHEAGPPSTSTVAGKDCTLSTTEAASGVAAEGDA